MPTLYWLHRHPSRQTPYGQADLTVGLRDHHEEILDGVPAPKCLLAGCDQRMTLATREEYLEHFDDD